MAQKNIEKLGALFPNVITEMIDDGKSTSDTVIYKKAVNFDLLKQMLSEHVIEGDEVYEFTWPGKKASIAEANAPTGKTLRPCVEESKNWETTENLYLEGDNLEVLKLLQDSYYKRVKMIYIDPPYNTGKDFIYKDNFKTDKERYHSTESNGWFHSMWCSMIYPRLLLSRNLLSDQGVIFISINDIEVENLKKICHEVFGAGNFVADLIWANKEGGGSSDSKFFRVKHEHILCYAKDINHLEISGVPISNEERYKLQDEYVNTRGKYYRQKLGMGSIQYSKTLDYKIMTPDGTFVTPSDNYGGRKACWRWSEAKFQWGLENGFIEMKKVRSGAWTVYTKQYRNCDNDGNVIDRTQRPMGVIEEYSSIQASRMLENMGMGGIFNYSKPVDLIQYLMMRCDLGDEIVLDFFSGSATTAHAAMKYNTEEKKHCKYIMVQLPEECKSVAKGYETICEIGKERIRRAGELIKKEYNIEEDVDIGFRVFKIDNIL